MVWSITAGRLREAKVQALSVVTPDRYLEISAGHTRLRVTDEHPFMIGPGEYRIAGELREGDRVYLSRQNRLHSGPRSLSPNSIRGSACLQPRGQPWRHLCGKQRGGSQ